MIAAPVLFATLVLGAVVPVATGGSGNAAETGTLALRAKLSWEGRFAGECPGTPPGTVNCYRREGRGVVPGLGRVSHSYIYPLVQNAPGCPAGFYRVRDYTASFTVAGKGQLHMAVPGSSQCLSETNVLEPTYPPITITGGSGIYAGASGSGTLTHDARLTSRGAAGTDTWIGSLVVPGLEFDVTAPILTGTAGKTVRAPKGATRARVVYKVAARDGVDGIVPVSCRPRSNSSFKIGRTVVTCSASDTSGNTGTAKFGVTVKPSR